ncbi:MAG: glutathione S-transferase [Salinisphaeraceae bacterium]|jgi:glutathione S-transferase|nr:glutathione S-transferase [Salinisphaeraceae bacterium]
MKLLDSAGPNPRMVRMFMQEKGIELPTEQIDLLGAENRGEAYVKRNPAGQIPALELEDGTVIAETVAMCEYLEDLNPQKALVGSSPEEKAETRMWVRRVELNITEHLYNGFRYAEGLGLFRDRVYCIPEAADEIKKKGQDGLKWLDGQLAGKQFIAGDRMTLADLVLYCCLDFVASVGQPLDPSMQNVKAWFDRMNARQSANDTLADNWEEMGMRM